MGRDSIYPDNNSIKTLLDEKRYLTLYRDFKLEVPSSGILDEPLRGYPVNEEWAKIITGIVTLLTEIAVWKDAQDETHPGIQAIEEWLIGMPVFDCEDVELCLPTSPTIVQINNNIASVEQSVSANTTSIINNTTLINEIEQEALQNTTLPLPESPAPDNLCSAAWYIEQQLYDLIVAWRNDVQTITLDEFLIGLLGLGGWHGSLLNLAWQWFESNYANPNFMANVDAARPHVREIIYCAELNYQQSIDDINASGDILPVAKGAYIQTWRATELGKRILWATVGQLATIGDCKDYDCNPVGQIIFDFVGDYTTTGNEAAIYTNTGYWTPVVGYFSPTIGLTDDNLRAQATRPFAGQIRHWRVYGRKDPSMTSMEPELLIDGIGSATTPGITSNNFVWTGLQPFKADGTLQTVNSEIALDLEKVFGGFNDYASVKWLDIRTE